MTTTIEFKAWLDSPLTKAMKQNHKEAVLAEREEIALEFEKRHEGVKHLNNYWLHAAKFVRARGSA
jgi:hypothetical protein